ncbi:pectinesterase inhibitor 7-like [Rhodamnia argentea]|uniref:Pectinesterase inhibitor 7-like n=1 Tax=Rhodamnia argentea TaxID=178133 RepID=A0A8B8R383_9MYRT|nr:pectinesterase inhibitor 7-like [Rhodamnia argentea]
MLAQRTLALLLHIVPFLAVPSPVPALQSDGTDFIRASCGETLYPDVCYSSLSTYAGSVQQSPRQLARAAIAVSLASAHTMAAYLADLSRRRAAEPRAASAALHDCLTNMGDAVGEMRGSLKQMRRLGDVGDGGSGGASQEGFRLQMSNVQTWMSAALTDEDTCTDGFEDVPEGELKSVVCGRAGEVKKVTSNALALVNSYVNKEAP